MNFQNILLENEGQISTITINRPQSLNALNRATIVTGKQIGRAHV